MNAGDITLADLGVGESAEVRAVGGDHGVARRLMEMGVLPGTLVRVVRVAPLGDPVEIRLRRYGLSIRRAEAASIVVTRSAERGPLPSAAGAR